MIDQITVFLENKKGRLSAMSTCLADAGINMQALCIAETTDYGIVRIIADDPAAAVEALKAADFSASVAKVSAVEVTDEPGGLARLLSLLDEKGYNVHYGYCFSAEGGKAIDVLKIHRAEEAEAVMAAAGFKVLSPL